MAWDWEKSWNVLKEIMRLANNFVKFFVELLVLSSEISKSDY